MSTIALLSTELGRRVRTARTSLPALFTRCWLAFALGVAAAVVILVIASTLALALLGVALLVYALPWTALLVLCATVLAAALAGVGRGL